jgi:hypothetical protein
MLSSHLCPGLPSSLLPSDLPTTCPVPSEESVQVRGALKHFVRMKNFYDEGLLAPRPTPSWRTTPCRLSATAYSVYSQLPSVSGGFPSIRNLRTRHAVVTRDTRNVGWMTIDNQNNSLTFIGLSSWPGGGEEEDTEYHGVHMAYTTWFLSCAGKKLFLFAFNLCNYLKIALRWYDVIGGLSIDAGKINVEQH